MKNWTLVFDLDGTLVDTAPDLADATNHVMRRLGLEPVVEAEIRPYVGHGALKMIERAAASHGRPLQSQELHDLFEAFIAHYTAHIADRSRPYDGAIAALEAARAQGARLAICTNKIEAHARQLLDALSISSYFAAVAGRDSFEVCKPNPGHLTGVIALASGDVKRAIMVGDSEVDIRTSKGAGVPIIAVDFGYSVEPVAAFEPDAVISHYRDLAPAIERLRQLEPSR